MTDTVDTGHGYGRYVRGGWGVSCRFSLPSACVFWVEFVCKHFLGSPSNRRSPKHFAFCGTNGGRAVGVNDPQTGRESRWARRTPAAF